MFYQFHLNNAYKTGSDKHDHHKSQNERNVFLKLMRYHGFSTRDYLILDNIPINKQEISVLEIGVRTGSTAELIIGRVKEFCGVDISRELIEVLSTTYRNNNDNVPLVVEVGSDLD